MPPPPSTLAVSRPRPASSPAQYAVRSSLGDYPGSFFLSSRTDGGAACDLHRRGPSTDRLPRDIITSNLRWGVRCYEHVTLNLLVLEWITVVRNFCWDCDIKKLKLSYLPAENALLKLQRCMSKFIFT
uniref:Uncharacterized protein n=2 Tax=Zea mays TaxID=4577 RepID=A0A804LYD7_MAIZE